MRLAPWMASVCVLASSVPWLSSLARAQEARDVTAGSSASDQPSDDELELEPALAVRTRGRVFVDPIPDQDDRHAIDTRARVSLSASYEFLRGFVQVQDARDFGSVPLGTDDGASTGVHQGYLEVAHRYGFVRLGRQELKYGNERMIGPLDWSTAARAFDALRIHTRGADLSLDVAAAVIRGQRTVTGADGMTTERSEGDYFAGAYATYSGFEPLKGDLFVLYRHDGATDGDLLRNRNIFSPGIRLYGTPHRMLRYDVEFSFQFGSAAVPMQGDEPHKAFAVAGDLRVPFPIWLQPVVWAGGSFATGEDADRTWSEFDNFFPTNHKFYGQLDLLGLRNMAEGHVGARVHPEGSDVSTELVFHHLTLSESFGTWKDAAGTTIAQGAGEANVLGEELDLIVRWHPLPQLFAHGGYGLFIPGGAAEQVGQNEVEHFFYLMAGTHLR